MQFNVESILFKLSGILLVMMNRQILFAFFCFFSSWSPEKSLTWTTYIPCFLVYHANPGEIWCLRNWTKCDFGEAINLIVLSRTSAFTNFIFFRNKRYNLEIGDLPTSISNKSNSTHEMQKRSPFVECTDLVDLMETWKSLSLAGNLILSLSAGWEVGNSYGIQYPIHSFTQSFNTTSIIKKFRPCKSKTETEFLVSI
jgi:hypothetical protein